MSLSISSIVILLSFFVNVIKALFSNITFFELK